MNRMDIRTAGRTELRSRNTHILLHLIQTKGPISQADLARRSGLSPATVSGIIQPLIENRLIVASGKNTKQGMGRRASLLIFNPETLMAIGLVIEPEECKIALVDFAGTVIGTTNLAYCPPFQPEKIADFIKDGLEKLLQEHAVNRDAIVGIGVATPGMVDAELGIVISAVNLGWRNIPLKQIIEEKLNIAVRIENIATAKTATEIIWGTGVDSKNIVLVEIGSGIGGGAVVNSQMLKGTTYATVEVGHTSLDLNGPLCQCGLQGCWEVYCNGPAIHGRMISHLNNDLKVETRLNFKSSLRDLQQSAEANDELALMVFNETAKYMARGLVNVIWNYDPEMIILTGYVVDDCPYLIEVTKSELKKLHAVRSMEVPLVKAKQGVNFGVISASALVSRGYLEDLAYFSS